MHRRNGRVFVRSSTPEERANWRPNPFALIEERLVKDGTFVGGATPACADSRGRELPWNRPQGDEHFFDSIAAVWTTRDEAEQDWRKNELGSEKLLGDEAEYARTEGVIK
jgi:hypothetical protein